MSTPFTQFTSPAEQAPKDYNKLGLEDQLSTFETDWNNNVTGWTQMSVIGNPWSNLNDAPRSGYYNPIESGYGTQTPVTITWQPFPNRLWTFFYNNGAAVVPQLNGQAMTLDQVMALTDHGQITLNGTLYSLYPDPAATQLQIPSVLCKSINWNGPYADFSPSGPRGWLDEYCEWSITRDPDGNMRSIMFTSENPAYFLTMWNIDPNAVLGLYQAYVDPQVKLEDLYLRYTANGPTGNAGDPVIDATTGRPAYDTVNKWNSGTVRIPGVSGGAMHLTSGPNTLSAEIYLAAAATILRPLNSSRNQQSLICCAQYGQNYRNSDPHIGFSANQAAVKNLISLTNPIGLYLQQPTSFSTWKGPQGQDVSSYWRVTRGTAGTGPNNSDQILQAVFEVPQSAGFSINDITINGTPINYVWVIAEQLDVALSVTPAPLTATPKECDCVAANNTDAQPWPVQLLPLDLFYGQSPSDLPASFAPATSGQFVLVVQGADLKTSAADARVQFSNPGISAEVTQFLPDASAIPGQTDSGGTQGYIMTVTVSSTATPGLVSVRALNPSEAANPSATEHPWESGLALVPGA